MKEKKPLQIATKPANRLETDTFYRVVSSLNSLALAQDDLKARAHLIPGGWRDLRACLALEKKLVHNLLLTFDEKKRGQIARQMKHMRVRVVFGPEASKEPETVMMDVEDLAVMMHAASGECRMRMCRPDECNNCQLGQVIDRCSFVTRDNRAWWEVIESVRGEQDTDNTSDMANTIKKLRIRAGLTQQELSVNVGVSQGTVAGWERGNSKPNVKSLKKLADALNASIDSLSVLM